MAAHENLQQKYARWDKIVQDMSDDDEPKPQLHVPDPRRDPSKPFPTQLVSHSPRVDGEFPHYHDWKLVNEAHWKSDFCVQAHGADAARRVVQKNYPWWLPCYDGLSLPKRPLLGRLLLAHHHAGYYADPDVMPIVPINEWLKRFERDDVAKANLLVVGLARPYAVDDSPFELCYWTYAATSKEHPVLYAAANVVSEAWRKCELDGATPGSLLTDAFVAYLQEHGRGDAVAALPASAEPSGLHVELPTCSVLVLPYRAFGFWPAPCPRAECTGLPERQQLVRKDSMEE